MGSLDRVVGMLRWRRRKLSKQESGMHFWRHVRRRKLCREAMRGFISYHSLKMNPCMLNINIYSYMYMLNGKACTRILLYNFLGCPAGTSPFLLASEYSSVAFDSRTGILYYASYQEQRDTLNISRYNLLEEQQLTDFSIPCMFYWKPAYSEFDVHVMIDHLFQHRTAHTGSNTWR